MPHIAGPWYLRHVITQDGSGGHQRWYVMAGEDHSIGICNMPGWDEDDEANAHLIAACPELLDFAESAITEHGALAERNHKYALRRLAAISAAARVVVAKAKGNQ